MTKTLHTPNGEKLRTATNRRYVTVHYGPPKANVEYRTDVLERAIARAKKLDRRYAAVYDTVTGEALYLPNPFLGPDA